MGHWVGPALTAEHMLGALSAQLESGVRHATGIH